MHDLQTIKAVNQKAVDDYQALREKLTLAYRQERDDRDVKNHIVAGRTEGHDYIKGAI